MDPGDSTAGPVVDHQSPRQGEPVRVAALWQQMTGYSRACLSAVADEGAELLLVHRDATPEAPYQDSEVAMSGRTSTWSSAPDEDRLRGQIEAFAPHVLLVCSWNVGAYRRISRSLRGRALRIVFMDNPWLGTMKQWGGRLVSPVAIRPAYDAAFLPDERQAAFARRLGFDDDRILWGAYTCDWPAFAAARRPTGEPPPRRLLFVGRLASSKGVDILADAYRRYHSAVADPWPLVVCGTGPLATELAGIPGVELRGFVQPSELPKVFGEAGCLVLPSTFEPWGVVIHEATTAGLAVVCTSACGAAARLVLDGYNGAVVAPGRAASLARGLIRVTDPQNDVALMGRRSTELAAQYSPDRWARYLLDRSRELGTHMGLPTASAGTTRDTQAWSQ